jgi:hypothetical protein
MIQAERIRMNNPATFDIVNKKPVTKGKPYSPAAEAKLEYFSVAYGKELVVEAERVAKWEDVDQISCIHVEEAKRRLRSIERRNWKKKLYGQVGGVSFGFGVSTLAPLLSNGPQLSNRTLIIGIVALLAGAVLLVLDALT